MMTLNEGNLQPREYRGKSFAWSNYIWKVSSLRETERIMASARSMYAETYQAISTLPSAPFTEHGAFAGYSGLPVKYPTKILKDFEFLLSMLLSYG